MAIRPSTSPEDPLRSVVTRVAAAARERLGPRDGAAFLGRVESRLGDLIETLDALYGTGTDAVQLLESLVSVALEAAEARPEPLRELDRTREANPRWFLASSMIGYVCYVDRFAGSLQGVRSRLDYLAELGTTYLHLMPVLAARPGENDGGYAVMDFDSIEPSLGTMSDLTELAGDLHQRGMSLCIDLVLNHTAREHEWAQRAMSGDREYRDYYLVFPDRTIPDEYERHLPDIFPELAPGNFTHVPELDGWVWTTFRDFQWDLNYANLDVLTAMLGTMLRLANRGADVLRVDAAPFLWKRLGTNCQDLPETHLVLQALSTLTHLAAPGLLLKAEAMLAPDLLGKYLGDHDPYRPECDLAYDNQLMVMLWSGVASGSGRLPGQALGRRRPAPEATTWVTYVRGHDDIGWAVADVDAAAVGLDGPTHRRFLSDFFAGLVPGSFARGARFQHSPVGEFPTSGTAASLCGIDAALADGDEALLELGLRRLETLYSVVFSFGGIPLVYMGDEVALLNDHHWADDPAHASDNRWMHRPAMDWDAVARRGERDTIEWRVWARHLALVHARRAEPTLGGGPATVLVQPNASVLAYSRGRPGSFVALVNFAVTDQMVSGRHLAQAGIERPRHLHSTTGQLELSNGDVEVPACGFVWLAHRHTHPRSAVETRAIHAELDSVRHDFRALVMGATRHGLSRATNGTKWTNEELLFHMLFGYLLVWNLLFLVRLMSWLPDGVSRAFAAALNAATRPFHVVNYVGSLGGARVLGRARMCRLLDEVTRSLERRLDREPPTSLRRGMHFPVGWDPYFADFMSLRDVYHYPTQHYDHHRAQLTLGQSAHR